MRGQISIDVILAVLVLVAFLQGVQMVSEGAVQGDTGARAELAAKALALEFEEDARIALSLRPHGSMAFRTPAPSTGTEECSFQMDRSGITVSLEVNGEKTTARRENPFSNVRGNARCGELINLE